MLITENQTKAGKFIALEDQYGAHNYHPLPVVLERGEDRDRSTPPRNNTPAEY